MAAPRRKKTDESEWKEELKEEGEPEKLSDIIFQEEKEAYERTIRMQTPPAGTTAITQRSSSMSMIDPSEWNLEDAQELTVLPEGTEVQFRILSVRKGTYGDEESGISEYWMPTLEVVDEPSVRDFTHFLNVPNRHTSTEKQFKQAQYNLRIFMECLKMSLSDPFSPMEDWPSMEGWAILSVKKSEEWGEQNYIKNPSSGKPSGGFIIR